MCPPRRRSSRGVVWCVWETTAAAVDIQSVTIVRLVQIRVSRDGRTKLTSLMTCVVCPTNTVVNSNLTASRGVCGSTTYTQTVWRVEQWNFIYANTCGVSVFLCSQLRPILMGRSRPASPKFWDLLRVRNNNQSLRGDRTRCEEIFYTVNHECWRAICLR